MKTIAIVAAALSLLTAVAASPAGQTPSADLNGYKCRCVKASSAKQALKSDFRAATIEDQLTQDCCGDNFSPFPQKGAQPAGDGFCYRLGKTGKLSLGQFHKCCSTAAEGGPYIEQCETLDMKAVINGKPATGALPSQLKEEITSWKNTDVEFVNNHGGSAAVIDTERDPVFWKKGKNGKWQQ